MQNIPRASFLALALWIISSVSFAVDMSSLSRRDVDVLQHNTVEEKITRDGKDFVEILLQGDNNSSAFDVFGLSRTEAITAIAQALDACSPRAKDVDGLLVHAMKSDQQIELLFDEGEEIIFRDEDKLGYLNFHAKSYLDAKHLFPILALIFDMHVVVYTHDENDPSIMVETARIGESSSLNRLAIIFDGKKYGFLFPVDYEVKDLNVFKKLCHNNFINTQFQKKLDEPVKSAEPVVEVLDEQSPPKQLNRKRARGNDDKTSSKKPAKRQRKSRKTKSESVKKSQAKKVTSKKTRGDDKTATKKIAADRHPGVATIIEKFALDAISKDFSREELLAEYQLTKQNFASNLSRIKKKGLATEEQIAYLRPEKKQDAVMAALAKKLPLDEIMEKCNFDKESQLFQICSRLCKDGRIRREAYFYLKSEGSNIAGFGETRSKIVQFLKSRKVGDQTTSVNMLAEQFNNSSYAYDTPMTHRNFPYHVQQAIAKGELDDDAIKFYESCLQPGH